jgi:major membrane immunogen (membrane-anchored lipoprotein)
MKTFFGLIVLALLLTACGQAATPPAATPEVTLSASVDPQPLAVGDATFIATLHDASGAPVDGATIHLHGDMDHEGMTPIDRESSESTNGEYRLPFAWEMGGGWIVTVTATLKDGGTITQDFTYFVDAVSSDSIINHSADAQPSVTIAYAPDTTPIVMGASFVTITVTDAQGVPVNDAQVAIIANMAHDGMMPVKGAATTAENGQYRIPLQWSMAGDWNVTVTVTLPDGRQSEQVFSQQVAAS